MIGIIGGSGFVDDSFLSGGTARKIKTPFGSTSSDLRLGKLGKKTVAVLLRHGRNHSIPPSQINFRANIWALKKIGVDRILAATACGSLNKKIKPGDLVFPGQFIDFTRRRDSTFFDKSTVVHLPMNEPFCPHLRDTLVRKAKELGFRAHAGQTVITIEGPRFSTRAESRMFQKWGADIINMTTLPEAILAREAGLCYQPVAMVTDYDSFDENLPAAEIASILSVMKSNAEKVKQLFQSSIEGLPDEFQEHACSMDVEKSKI